MWEQALANFAAGAGRGLTGSDAPSSLMSGAPADLRSGFSNAGWTVVTGRGNSAEGAKLTGDPVQGAFGATPVFSAGQTTAGGGLLLPLLIGGVVLAVILAKKKKG
jgi:hypothetical protein